MRSPEVRIVTISIVCSATPCCCASAARVMCACASASGLPRVPDTQERGLRHITSKCYGHRLYHRPARKPGNPMLVLGIETTCDETAASVVRRHADGRGEILSNIVLSQTDEHAPYGGVVPEIAARAHVEVLDLIIAKAMVEANVSFDVLAGVAAAAGPGLIGGVIVGLTTAKSIALVAEKPLIAINHLEAQALTARLTDATEFPYCLFLASGGPYPDRRSAGCREVRAAGHHRSTMRSARRSTRPPSCSASPIRADPRSSARRARATASASSCRVRCSAAPRPTSRCPD
jgi:hypothetical protein